MIAELVPEREGVDLGVFLQQCRAAHRPEWTQSDVARAVGVSPPTISRLESGVTQHPPMELLARVAPHYGVSVLDLWHRAGYLTTQDAAAMARLLGQLAPHELIRLAFELGPWGSDIQRAVNILLAATPAELGQWSPTNDAPR
jgi:transcriptional regulator with XRE-family HTH domain